MKTTYAQQMAAIKYVMNNRKDILKLIEKAAKNINSTRWNNRTHIKSVYPYIKDRRWLALNDAYSTIAALRLNESLKSSALM